MQESRSRMSKHFVQCGADYINRVKTLWRADALSGETRGWGRQWKAFSGAVNTLSVKLALPRAARIANAKLCACLQHESSTGFSPTQPVIHSSVRGARRRELILKN
ncbi:hypothetical protein JZ751_013854 [Albula glossodonta]|uniref:Uncharacterized protein n=1 Tax=Albula glossodonta TaxID=121402 RepID=A0A8T2MY37_9TELE|nr:hypothetical protein JZ751_013854 [Albula glossodonta]